jgi:hypothetical protein
VDGVGNARSAASAPMAMASLARRKSNQPIER